MSETRRSASAGGCWICNTGNGFEDDGEEMAFDTEFDTFYHEDCLEDTGCDSILEYERQGVENSDTDDIEIDDTTLDFETDE